MEDCENAQITEEPISLQKILPILVSITQRMLRRSLAFQTRESAVPGGGPDALQPILRDQPMANSAMQVFARGLYTCHIIERRQQQPSPLLACSSKQRPAAAASSSTRWTPAARAVVAASLLGVWPRRPAARGTAAARAASSLLHRAHTPRRTRRTHAPPP